MPEPCPVYGHHSLRAETCVWCRSEFLETGTWPTGSRHHQATHTPAAPDARSLAAGMDRDQEQS